VSAPIPPRQVDVEKVGELLSQRIGDLTHQNAVQAVMMQSLADENAALRTRLDELTPKDVEPSDEGPGDSEAVTGDTE